MAIKIYRSSANGSVIVENIINNSKQSFQAVICNEDSNGNITLNGISTFNSPINGGQALPLSDILDVSNNPYPSYTVLVDTVGFRKANGGGGGAVSSVNSQTGAVIVNLDSVLAQVTALTDGVFAISVIGGVATAVPIQGETVGIYKHFATTTIPSNYLWCNGAILPIASYPDLFAVIGNDYGGDGITTFGIPNLQGRFLQGDNGSNIGTESGLNTLNVGQLPVVNASGTIQVSTNPPNIAVENGSFFANTDGFIANGSQGTTVNVAGVQLNSFGSNQPHEHPHLVARIAICFQSVGISGASPTPSFEQTLAVNPNTTILPKFNGVDFATVDNVNITQLASIIPTAASTTTLTIASNTKQIFTGSVFGTILNLGDATTYLVGKSWFLKSNASQTVSIVNNANTEIYRLEPQCNLEVTLQDNTTANGVWLFNVQYPCSERMTGYNDSFLAGTSTGQTNFSVSSAGGGAGVTLTTSIFGRIGAVTMSTGTTNSGRTCLNKNSNGVLFGTGVCVLVKNIRFEDLSTAVDRYFFYCGFGDNTAAGNMLDGVYFKYDEGASGNFWVLETSNNSVRSTIITAIPIVADTWYKLKIEVNELGTRADFFVNDVNVGNITTNIPIVAGRNTSILQKIEKTAGSIARLAYTNLSNFRNYPNS
jgi:microcystin-dependent protein